MQMRFPIILSFAASTVLVSLAGDCLADNPIIQTKYTADPAPLVYGDTVYLYTTHDEDDAVNFTMYDWMLYSSKDMVNWTDHGTIATVAPPNKTFSWADGNNAWADQVIFRNDKFYLYAPLPRSGHMVIGVAIADSPEGPFVDAIGEPLINNPNSSYDIDPTVFIDDDGQAYLYWGHQPPVFYVKLNEDMISYSGDIVELTKPQTYEEGPWFYKRNDQYYLAFASTCCPEGIGYAMSDSPTGPWTFAGSIMDGNAQSSGNHPGIIDFKGKSYVFGFNYAVQLAREGTRVGERRSICLDELTYNADGTIEKLPFWDDTSAPQVGTLDPYVQTEAETIAWAWDVQTEPCDEGGMDVTSIDNGDYIKVAGVDFGNGATSLEVRVASGSGGGSIEVRLDGENGTLVGTCDVSDTGGDQSWTTETCSISGASGVHDLYFVFTGGSGRLFNFDWWKFDGDSGQGGTGGQPGIGGGPSAGGDSGLGGSGDGGTHSGGSGTGGAMPGSGGAVPGGGAPSVSGGVAGATPGTGGAVPGGGGAVVASGGTVVGSGGSALGSGGNAAAGVGASSAMGGSSLTSGGATSGGGVTDATGNGKDSSGCSCKLARSSDGPGAPLGLLAGVGLLGWYRGRRRRCRS